MKLDALTDEIQLVENGQWVTNCSLVATYPELEQRCSTVLEERASPPREAVCPHVVRVGPRVFHMGRSGKVVEGSIPQA